MNNSTLVTGRHGIGPIGLDTLNRRMRFLRTAESFSREKDAALEARNRGDIESARWWAKEARADWRRIVWAMQTPIL